MLNVHVSCLPQIKLLWEVLLYRQKGVGDSEAGQVALAALVCSAVAVTTPRCWSTHSRCRVGHVRTTDHLLQIGKRIRSSITEPRRTAANKRFLERHEGQREVGFAMLRLGPHPHSQVLMCLTCR